MPTAKLPSWLSAALVVGTGVTLFWLERRQPLRPARESTLRRTARNLVIAITNAAAVQLAEQPLAKPRLYAAHRPVSKGAHQASARAAAAGAGCRDGERL